MDNANWDRWDHLAPRYRAQVPRRILALDGGGIRGLITLGVLARLERELAAASDDGTGFRLCQYFDLIGGTSTGAIIAAGLARGMSVSDITAFYRRFGREAFHARRPWDRLTKSKYDASKLASLLRDTFGPQTDLHPQHLECLLVVVTRNVTTDSAWPISSNPFAKYNEPSRPDCNLQIPLWQLVRASTAAPTYFPPETVSWGDDPEKRFVFVDGGTTPYNNPSFLLFRMATVEAYNLRWTPNERDLLIVSVGTGGAAILGPKPKRPEANKVSTGLLTMQSLMSQASIDQDVNCRVIGRCTHGGTIDREVRDLLAAPPAEPLSSSAPASQGKAFVYARYDADLTVQGLADLGVTGVDPKQVSGLDATDSLDDLERIGAALGSQVDLEHLGSHAPGRS
jgi:hypothetical protein